jgi:hypothetical protein
MKHLKLVLTICILFISTHEVLAQYYGNQRGGYRNRQQQQAIPSAPEKAPEPLTVEESVDQYLEKNQDLLQLDEFQKAVVRVSFIDFANARQKIIEAEEPREAKVEKIKLEQEKFEASLQLHLSKEQFATWKTLQSPKEKRKEKKKKKKRTKN